MMISEIDFCKQRASNIWREVVHTETLAKLSGGIRIPRQAKFSHAGMGMHTGNTHNTGMRGRRQGYGGASSAAVTGGSSVGGGASAGGCCGCGVSPAGPPGPPGPPGLFT